MPPPPSGKRERPGRSRLQPAGRWLVLGAAVALAWPWRPESSTSVLLPALSPFIAVASAVSLRAVGVLTLLALPVLLLVLFSPRWFCRQACPVGWLQEILESRSLRSGRFPPESRSRRPRSALIPFLHAIRRRGRTSATRSVTVSRPNVPRHWLRWPAVGRWLVLLTLGGAVLGYPLFLWLDPLALFNGFLNAWRQPIALATLLTGLGLPLLLVLDLAAPRLWCQHICPLGATQDLLAWPRRRFQAQSCGLEPDRVASVGKASHGRRWFLAACAGAAAAFAVRPARGQSPLLLRPPGALDEEQFTGVCVRCGNCAQVCPSHIIQPDFGASGVAGWLTPRLRFDSDYCREDCHRCNEVCPSGALARLSLADKRRRVVGQAVVDPDRCLLAQGRECTACIQKCPYEAMAMHRTDGGFSQEPRVLRDRCTGCGACEAVCPVPAVRAVRVQAPTIPATPATAQQPFP